MRISDWSSDVCSADLLRYDAPFNYSAINNWAVAQCESAGVGLVNNDLEVNTGDWLEEMVSQALRPGLGAVGAMLYSAHDTIPHACVALGVHRGGPHLYAGTPRGSPAQGGREGGTRGGEGKGGDGG